LSDKAQRPPAGEPWAWLTRELLVSDAWRSLGVNGRRFIDFLLIEHMSRGGKHNGKLKAPFRQLVAFGISSALVADEVRNAERFGLIESYRGGMRVATTYALGWLPLHDKKAAPNRWRAYRNPKLIPLSAPKSKNLHSEVSAALPSEVSADA
jgi:hypothetical protein